MPDYRIFQIIVSGVAVMYLYVKSRQMARDGQSTMPEVVQILMWVGTLILASFMPERVGPIPFFVLALIVIVIVSTRLNLWRVRQQQEAMAERRRQAAAKQAAATQADETNGIGTGTSTLEANRSTDEDSSNQDS